MCGGSFFSCGTTDFGSTGILFRLCYWGSNGPTKRPPKIAAKTKRAPQRRPPKPRNARYGRMWIPEIGGIL